MTESVKRLYERYEFTALAVIVMPSGEEITARVSNISYGGCLLLTTRKLPIGAELTVKIHTFDQEFEAPVRVVHSGENHVGMMFGKITPAALFVLQKWISDVRYLQSVSAVEERLTQK